MNRMDLSEKWNLGWSLSLRLTMVLLFLLTITTLALAQGDDRSMAGRSPVPRIMPPLGPEAFGTDYDNEDNAGTGNPDYDMDDYVYNDNPNAPIEFNIFIPLKDAAKLPARLRMDVYDVDTTGTVPEIDEVYVNGVKVGVLNGRNNAWGINIFDIPIGTLRMGKNLVQVQVDVRNGGWAVSIDWGIIYVKSASSSPQVMKAWIAPVEVAAGNYINAYAVVSGSPDAVKVYYGTKYLFSLTDPDGDYTYSGQFLIPATWAKGYKNLTIKVYKDGRISSRWPSIRVK